MATSETTNLQLVKYGAGTDNFIRTDYNGNLDKIDTFAGNTNEAIGTLSNLKTPTKTNLVSAINETFRVKEIETASATSWTITVPVGIQAHLLAITSANGTIWGLYYVNCHSNESATPSIRDIAVGSGAPTITANANRTINVSVVSARILYITDVVMYGNFLTVA